MTTRSSLASLANENFARLMTDLGFERGRRNGVYLKHLGEDALMYVMCRPRTRSGSVILEPMIALENTKVRSLIGEDEPKQSEPRFAHLFLSYTIDSGMTIWEFNDVPGMDRAIEAIRDALRRGAIPFAERWTRFPAAIALLRRALEADLPWGVIAHPTRTTKLILSQLPDEGETLH